MKPANYPQRPKDLWQIFYEFTQTPRPSKHEEKIVDYLIKLAVDNKLRYVKDKVGNIIIYVPGKNGREAAAPVIIQNHIDMVTDALVDVKIDFNNDPILTEVDGEWLTAKGTTLGADNGIGCAAALATIFSPDLVHPPLELLFTVDEETGLNGALGLEHEHLSAKKMLNLDTEEWGSLYIGCAGGIDYELTKDISIQRASTGLKPYKIQVEGFVGGHSGVDIHEQRGNALKFLAQILNEFYTKAPFELAEVRGGKAHNIIPRDAFAILYSDAKQIDLLAGVIEDCKSKWRSFMPMNDQSFTATITSEESFGGECLDLKYSKEIINYMTLFPHGVHAYDLNDRSLVSMSNNFARFLVVKGKVYTQSSLRFFDREEVKTLESQLKVLGDMFQMKVENHSEYPSWKPVRENPILDLVQRVYTEQHGRPAEVTAIHAGLECGILRDKIGPIDVVSFGPTITGAHSPDERVHIPSVEQFWSLFTGVLAQI